ncbi:MAG: hypothetical protein GX220_02380 [Treponema sp.]|jgi:hypothetical protein|nr:hypothetical protein [Treponema sp.]
MSKYIASPALSNVLFHNEKENTFLLEWLNENNFYLSFLSTNYDNATYRRSKKVKKRTVEVLVTNYEPLKKQGELFKSQDEIYRKQREYHFSH